MSCQDHICESCLHSLTRHQRPANINEKDPKAVVCMECLYGPRRPKQ